jgi:DNA polymerase-3 subunit delta'
MYFKDIIGQHTIKQRLIRSARQGQVPHALLLQGETGTGTLQLAIAFARYLSCSLPGENDACGTCPSCLQFNKLAHPDLHFVFPIFKPNYSKKWTSDDFINPWRSIILQHGYFSYHDWMTSINAGNAQGMIYAEESDNLIRKLSFKAYESDYKTIIIWLPEKMNEVCSNKLLKLLEEPPESTIFMLVTENKDWLLPTIVSRTQLMLVKGIETADLQTELNKRFSLPQENLTAACRMAEGNLLKALEYLDSSEEMTFFLEQFIRYMRGVYTIAHFSPENKAAKQRSLKDLKVWSEEMAKMGREQAKKFLAYAQHLIRENFILSLNQPELNYLNQAEKAFSANFHSFINHRNIQGFMEELELAEKQIEGNVNARLVFFDLALRSILLFKV